MKVSIIVPAYNAGKNIKKLFSNFKKLNHQSFEVEFLIVNDGSTDDTWIAINNNAELILQTGAELKLFNTENFGSASARNLGLSKSTGDFIWFVDADDEICLEALVYLKNNLEKNIDIYEFSYLEKVGDLEQVWQCEEEVQDSYNYLLNTNGRLYVWNKIFTRQALLGCKFTEKLINIEDFELVMNVLSKGVNVKKISSIIYMYIANPSSTSKDLTQEKIYKLAQDSIIVHGNLFAKSKTISPNIAEAFVKPLEKSVLGFLYSLVRYDYSPSYLTKVFKAYYVQGYIPLKQPVKGWKASSLKAAVNLSCFFYGIFKFIK